MTLSEETKKYTAQYGHMRVSTDYHYQPKRGGSNVNVHLDYPAVLDRDNSKKLEYEIRGGRFKKEVLESMADRAKDYAQVFLRSGGHIKTGTLYNSISSSVKGNSIKLTANTKYAGHIEYGFHHRGNNRFIGPFPYIRPAIQAVQAESHGVLEEWMKDLLAAGYARSFTGDSFGKPSHGLTNMHKDDTRMTFGKEHMSKDKNKSLYQVSRIASSMNYDKTMKNYNSRSERRYRDSPFDIVKSSISGTKYDTKWR